MNKGDDLAFGGLGNDTLRGNEGNDTLYGGEGMDTLTGEAGDDIIYGGDDGDYIRGLNDDDTLYGEGGEDTIEGGLGDDKLFGGADNDTLNGGDGQDTLDGGDGADVLSGREGNDTYTGGDDADTFEFDSFFTAFDVIETDRITDFDETEGDTILVRGLTDTGVQYIASAFLTEGDLLPDVDGTNDGSGNGILVIFDGTDTQVIIDFNNDNVFSPDNAVVIGDEVADQEIILTGYTPPADVDSMFSIAL